MFRKFQIFAAPLAGISDRPFRTILRLFSTESMLLTEMISCHSLASRKKNCLRNFDNLSLEPNVGAQLFGADPKVMGIAAKILQDNGASWIDINMGCPVAKVATKASAGAHLMRDHCLAESIIKSVVNSVSIPVSIKTRLGWDDDSINWTELVQIAADNGASFSTIHGRTRAAGYTGPAQLPQKPNATIPIIANGDIKSISDVLKYKELGYDGAMIGRGLFGKPWVLGQLTGELQSAPTQIAEIISLHMELVLGYYGTETGVPLFRKYLAWYSSGFENSSEFRTRVNQITDVAALKSNINEFFN